MGRDSCSYRAECIANLGRSGGGLWEKLLRGSGSQTESQLGQEAGA